MPLSFPNIATLGVQQQARFFDAGFNYSTSKTYQIQGLVTDLANGFGVTGIWSGVGDIVRNANDYQPLLINGVNFGSGRIDSISFTPGIDVKTKGYSASVIVLESGNLNSLTGTYYSGVNLVAPQYIDDFSEGWDFQHKQNGGYSYTHNANIRFTSGVGQLNAIDAARNMARSLFTGFHIGFAFYSGFSDKQGKRFFTESYNLIDNSCAFSESFEFNSNQGNYSVLRNQSVELNQDGVINASERATINGIENPNYQRALSAIAGELAGAYVRCSGLAANYFSGQPILIGSPLAQGRSVDIFNNAIGYDITFNNNPNNSGSYFWDYTQEVNTAGAIGSVSENGNIVGRGANPTASFAAAQAGLTVIRAGIPGRTTSLFSSNFGNPTNFLLTKQEGYSPYRGQTTYAYTYSNDPSLIADAGIRRKQVAIESARPLYLFNKVDIFNEKQIVQNDRQSTAGATTITVSLEGDKTVDLPTFLSTAVSEVNSNAPVGNDRFVGNAEYAYNPNANGVNARVLWVYNRSAPVTLFP